MRKKKKRGAHDDTSVEKARGEGEGEESSPQVGDVRAVVSKDQDAEDNVQTSQLELAEESTKINELHVQTSKYLYR